MNEYKNLTEKHEDLINLFQTYQFLKSTEINEQYITDYFNNTLKHHNGSINYETIIKDLVETEEESHILYDFIIGSIYEIILKKTSVRDYLKNDKMFYFNLKLDDGTLLLLALEHEEEYQRIIWVNSRVYDKEHVYASKVSTTLFVKEITEVIDKDKYFVKKLIDEYIDEMIEKNPKDKEFLLNYRV